MLECSVNPNLGDLEMIWNSSASHLSHYTILKHQLQLLKHQRNPSARDPKMLLQRRMQFSSNMGCFNENLEQEAKFFQEETKVLMQWTPVYSVDRLPKGWNKEWGSLQLPCSRARIGKLLDRDYVWAVTQTMVSFENLALWAVHTLRYYKVYPGFWGRRLLSFKSRALNNTSVRRRTRCACFVP
jgi:hypothetical protein